MIRLKRIDKIAFKSNGFFSSTILLFVKYKSGGKGEYFNSGKGETLG